MTWNEDERRKPTSSHDLDIRVSLLEQSQKSLDQKLDDINKNLTWLVRIVLAGVIGGMMTLVITGGRGVIT